MTKIALNNQLTVRAITLEETNEARSSGAYFRLNILRRVSKIVRLFCLIC